MGCIAANALIAASETIARLTKPNGDKDAVGTLRMDGI